MSVPKVFVVLRAFNKDQVEGLQRFMNAQIAPDSDPYRLFKCINNNDKEGMTLDNFIEDIHINHFPNHTRKTFLNICSRLFRYVDQYTAIYQMLSEPYQQELYKIKFYNRHGLYKFANQTATKIHNRLSKNNRLHIEESKILSEVFHHQYYSDNPIKYQTNSDLLSKATSSFLEHFKAQSLLYLCELENWGSLRNQNFNEIIASFETSLLHLPDTALSIQLQKLKSVIFDHNEALLIELSNDLFIGKIDDSSDLHVIFTLYLINYSLKFWQLGGLRKLGIISDLFNYGLETKVLLRDAKIPEERFNYICSVMAATNSYENTDQFIHKWIGIVDSPFKESIRLVAMAQNCLYHDREEEILHYTRSVKSANRSLLLRVLSLNIISLYKSRKEDLLLLHNRIKNYKVVLRQQKRFEDKTYYQANVNFIKVIQLLLKQDQQEIEIDLASYSPLDFRLWLSKQLKNKQ